MQLIFWILFGAITGIIINIKNPNPRSVLGTVLLGIWGAVLGGFLADIFFSGGIFGSIASICIALGASLILVMTQRALLRNH